MAGEIVWSGSGPMGLPVVDQAKATGRKGSGVTITIQVRGYNVPCEQEVQQTISLHMSSLFDPSRKFRGHTGLCLRLTNSSVHPNLLCHGCHGSSF